MIAAESTCLAGSGSFLEPFLSTCCPSADQDTRLNSSYSARGVAVRPFDHRTGCGHPFDFACMGYFGNYSGDDDLGHHPLACADPSASSADHICCSSLARWV